MDKDRETIRELEARTGPTAILRLLREGWRPGAALTVVSAGGACPQCGESHIRVEFEGTEKWMGRGAFTTSKCLCDLGGAFLLEAEWWNEAKILTLTQDPTIAHEVYYLLERARAEVINLCQENGWTEDETSGRIRPIDELQYYLGLYLRLGKEQAGRVRRRVEDWLRKEASEWDLLELAYRSGVSLD